jgi:hypothetical protein
MQNESQAGARTRRRQIPRTIDENTILVQLAAAIRQYYGHHANEAVDLSTGGMSRSGICSGIQNTNDKT